MNPPQCCTCWLLSGHWQDSHSLTYIRTVSVLSQLYSLPLLTWRTIRYGTDVVVSLHVLSSHSWIISYNLKWYKTSVVFTTVFHRALLSCRRQQSWIVSSVWILAPRLWLRCWLQDVQSSSISIPAQANTHLPSTGVESVNPHWVSRQDSAISDRHYILDCNGGQ
jgi:hypothetical protein